MKKYVIVGAGNRGLWMFAKPLTSELKDAAELVGIYDVNPIRAEFMSKSCGNVPVYDDFEGMLSDTHPDGVIVTTPDSLHDEYIIRALQAGYDVISEKPMTMEASKCRAILEAEKAAGKQVTVTFNCRFMPYVVRIKELLSQGTIGDILSVNLEWSLDRSHGADYFRRWHRKLENSGGLLVHKSTHHFDMVNWWLHDEPEVVYAQGARHFYGPTREERGERCLTCKHKDTCEFYFDITADDTVKQLYYEAEQQDGYFRDQCVFSEEIDIYDTMSLSVKYARGTLLTYSLNAYCPYEGWKITFNGTKGRIEAEEISSGPKSNDPNQYISIYNNKGDLEVSETKKLLADHGGGDEHLRRMIFRGDVPDVLGQQAGSRAGAMSLLVGAAANISIADKRPVSINELLGEDLF
ncbi:Gfo/Idh/MocA family oxidoreductase [Cohnella soli]|uniref:Gfo/Idh/MocA family oxidoreductase n=1 Tax=Cohnella soli TaxID=425005 RepID=A0ABW0HLR3_9BACL